MKPENGTDIFLSVIIPVYNSDATLTRLVNTLHDQLDWVERFEIVLVNDGSSLQETDRVCRKLAEGSERVVYALLARNFGEHNAVMAGMNLCRGDYAVIIDDDFQNPPEEIRRMVELAHSEGYDVVYSYYAKKKHTWYRNLGSRFNDLATRVMLKKPRDLYLSSFKVVNRFLIDEMIKYTGPYPYIDGLVLRSTRNIGRILVEHRARTEGRSNYTFRKLVRLWLNMFTNFSVLPLRIASVTGMLFALGGLVLAVAFWIEKMANPELPVGWASLATIVLVMGGAQLAAIGVVGEYLGRLYLMENNMPQYVIRRQTIASKTDHT